MARGFVYLAVVLDWFSRRVLVAKNLLTDADAKVVEANLRGRKFEA